MTTLIYKKEDFDKYKDVMAMLSRFILSKKQNLPSVLLSPAYIMYVSCRMNNMNEEFIYRVHVYGNTTEVECSNEDIIRTIKNVFNNKTVFINGEQFIKCMCASYKHYQFDQETKLSEII